MENNENIIERIGLIEKGLKAGENLRQKAIAQKDVYESQLENLNEELKAEGTNSAEALNEVNKISEDIINLLDEAEGLIPFDLLREYKQI